MAQSFRSLPSEDEPSSESLMKALVPFVNGISIRKSCDDDDNHEWFPGFLFH